MKMMLSVVMCGLMVLSQSMPVWSAMAWTGPKNGEQAPDFTLVDSKGMEHSLKDFAGKHVVLEWLNHDCPFVKKHYDSNNMQSLQGEFTNKGVVWLSVISSAPGKQGYATPENANTLKEAKGSKATAVLLDTTGEVGQLYAAKTTPHMYVIDPEGVLIYQGAIDSTPSADPADIASSVNYVSQALSQSMNGEAISMPKTKAYGCSVKY